MNSAISAPQKGGGEMEKRMPDPMLELKQMRIWMLWRWEVKENGERTKVPIAAGGGPSGTTEKWNRTWVTYDEVVKAEEKKSCSGRYRLQDTRRLLLH
jgi:primase-polymerase (primpol)-like protein